MADIHGMCLAGDVLLLLVPEYGFVLLAVQFNMW